MIGFFFTWTITWFNLTYFFSCISSQTLDITDFLTRTLARDIIILLKSSIKLSIKKTPKVAAKGVFVLAQGTQARLVVAFVMPLTD